MQINRNALSAAILAGLASLTGVASAATIDLRVIETTDIHSNVMDYDYYKDKPTERFGLVRAAALVNKVREEAVNSILVDNGDLIQGSPMGDYMADTGLKEGDVHPVYKVMNQLGYEVGNLGNHEFNYGLDYLKKATDGAAFPYINANIFDAKTGEHFFTPYIIKSHRFKDSDGQLQTVKVGYIGFVPPQILQWDRKNLEGKVTVRDIKKTAEALVPEMKSKGADIIVAIPHSGFSQEPYKAMAENSVYYLSEVNGIDAIMFGHAHAVFPGKGFANIPGVNLEKGTINGVPSVMPGRWGDHVGVVDLKLDNGAGTWKVINAKAEAKPVFDQASGKAIVEADERLVKSVESEHKATREFVSKPIGKASAEMYSFLALVQDDPTIQIVNNAQIDYVERFVQGDPDLEGIPVLSAAAPFKVGGRKNDPHNYTEVEKGTLTFRNAADLYLYPNTLVALKVTGKEVRDWLERSAGQFNQINPNSEAPQALINWDTFRTYNFDIIEGVEYQIDVTQPSRFDKNGRLVNPQSHRITQLTYKGKPVDPEQTFIIATNNYRAYGGGEFAGTGKDFIAFASPDENRQILSDYIARETREHGEVKPVTTNNWKLAPIKSDKSLNIYFETSSSKKAADFIKKQAIYPVQKTGVDSMGFALYKIDLKG